MADDFDINRIDEVIHGRIRSLCNNFFNSVCRLPDRFIHQLTFTVRESGQHMIRQIPALGLSTYADFDPDKILSAQLLDNVF